MLSGLLDSVQSSEYTLELVYSSGISIPFYINVGQLISIDDTAFFMRFNGYIGEVSFKIILL